MAGTKRNRLGELLGASAAMQAVYERIEQAAASDVTVLLTGPSGTGKELAARAIVEMGSRRNGPFITVNAGAIPRDLTASELFGHEEGSFTGATKRHVGKFEAAHRGTLFLDEIAATDPATQVALLRALEERAVTRLGAHRPIPVDVRFIAATNEDLERAIRQGRFREDLYYRLDIFQIRMPPLRERGADLLLLAGHFLEEAAEETGKRIRGFDGEVIDLFAGHDWPGNVRELRNAVQRAVVAAQEEVIHRSDLPMRVQAVAPVTREIKFKLRRRLSDIERDYVMRTLDECGGNKQEASRALGISRKSLYEKLARWAKADAEECEDGAGAADGAGTPGAAGG